MRKLLALLAIPLFLTSVIALVSTYNYLSQEQLDMAVSTYNKFIDKVPENIKEILGNEIIELHYVLNGTEYLAGVKTENGKITESSIKPYDKSTVALFVGEETINKISSSKNPVQELKKAWGSEIKWKGITLKSKIKAWFMGWGIRKIK